MIYLSGHARFSLRHPQVGFMTSPQIANTIPDWIIWAADNGRFSNPDGYSDEKYLAWLRRQNPRKCLFATAPDVLADHAATVVMSEPLFPLLRSAGYKPAFVAQDGWSEWTTPWHEFDCLFIGGTNKFKLGLGGQAIRAAHKRGKHVHMGRVNSYQRLRVAAALGCHSADGTYLKFGPDINEPKMLRWLERLTAQPLMKFHQ